MKRFLLILVLMFGTTIPFSAFATGTNLLVLNQEQSHIEVYDPNIKLVSTVEIGLKPETVIKLPDQNGYLALYRGDEKLLGGSKPGGLIYLDANLKPTSKKITLPGLLLKDFYFKASQTWFLITSDGTVGTLNIFDIRTGSLKKYDLNAMPVTYRFNNTHSQLAITTLGNAKNKVLSQLVLFDVAAQKTVFFPVSTNPGGIYFMNDGRVMVACGGFRNTERYLDYPPHEETDQPVPAKLYFVDPTTGHSEVIPLGFSSLTIMQDVTSPNTFFAGCIRDANPNEPAGIFIKIVDAKIAGKTEIPSEPIRILRMPSGNICLLGREEFFVIDPQTLKVLTTVKRGLQLDDLSFNASGTFGYLSLNSGSTLDVIDASTGQRTGQLPLKKPSLLSSPNFGGWLNTPYSPVIGMIEPLDDKENNVSPNLRMFFSTDRQTLYTASSNGISIIDTQTNKIKSTIRFAGDILGIHPTPNGKYIVATTDIALYLIDRDQKNPILKIPFLISNTDASNIPNLPEQGFYSSDGVMLAFLYDKTLYLIDTDHGKLQGRYQLKSANSLILWQP